MSLSYEMTLPIDSRDVDGNGYCKASALLGHIQEAATQAAEHGGFGRAMTTDGYHAFWMLTRVWYQLRRPLRWEEPLTIRTWHRGDKGATMYPDYDLFVDGEAVGECVSAWVLASMDTRQIIRLATVHELDGTGGGGAVQKQEALQAPPASGPGAGRAAEAALQRHRSERPCEQHPVMPTSPATPWRWSAWVPTGSCPPCRSAIWPSAAPERSCSSGQRSRTGPTSSRGWTKEAKSRFEAALIFGEVLP